MGTCEDADPVIRAVSDTLVIEIGKTLDFFKAAAPSDQIDRIVLSGGTSRVIGFAAAVADRFGTCVESFDPFLQIDAGRFSEDHRTELCPIAAVAVGLALRRANDR